MPRQNRVTPYGTLESVPDRGLFWGNRGHLLNADGELARTSGSRLWLICLLEFKGRRRVQWRPGHLTELYFLDEATGLAAGHRPCGECRYPRYKAFKQAWAQAYPGEPNGAQDMNNRLHADRLVRRGEQRTHQAPLDDLPDGTMVELDGQPWLVLGPHLLAWSHGGYRQKRDRPRGVAATVLTPRATVAVLAAGYRPVPHPTASG
ncbi:MAG: hypothetical protein ACRDNF_23115 [Streptosporangiaceae bacterium]